MFDFLNKAKEYNLYTIAARRKIHSFPELGWHEFKTSDFICSQLEEIGIKYERIKTAVIAKIETGKAGKNVVLRADMDAISLREETKEEYSSQNIGVMHACGHDGHTASLITALKILYEIKNELNGTITAVFQPSEESLPSGAEMIVKSGKINDADAVFGIHFKPELETGTVSVFEGFRMAASAVVDIEITSKGCHAGSPWEGSDATLAAAAVIMNLQSIVSRELPLDEQAVITIGKISSGSARNTVSDKAVMEGTCRYYKDGQEKFLAEAIKRIAENTASAYRAKADVNVFFSGCGAVYNNPELTKTAERAVENIVGKENNLYVERSGVNEDFSHYRKIAPSVFAFVGCKRNSIQQYGLHSPKFNIDENALAVAAAIYAEFAVQFLTEM